MPETPSVAVFGRTPDTRNYENALKRIGIPRFTTTDPEEACLATHLLLPGGGDITPAFFGQKDHGSRNVDTALDILQFSVLARFVSDGKPTLGICKGLQLINVHFGGDLFQNIATADSHKWIGRDQFHRVYHDGLSRRDFFYQLYGAGAQVNSAHHQAVNRMGDGLTPVCRAGDGVIEGLVHRTLPIMAVQWHPERMPDAAGDALIRYFCSLSRV